MKKGKRLPNRVEITGPRMEGFHSQPPPLLTFYETPRGRPKGTGHPKKKLADLLVNIGIADIDRLKKAGLTDPHLRTLYALINNRGIQNRAAKELGISPQAVNARWKKRIETAFRNVNPRFSSRKFLAILADRDLK